MKIAVPKELFPDEARVALVPSEVAKLVKAGYEVAVEKNAGVKSSYSDEAYKEAGAVIVASVEELYKNSNVTLKV